MQTHHTFNIDGDPFAFALDRDAFRYQILNPTATNGPIDIIPPQIAGHACHIDESEIFQVLQRQVLTIGSVTIFAHLRKVMAPDYAASCYCRKDQAGKRANARLG